MASDLTIPLEQLLHPIAGEMPAGDAYRKDFGSPYEKLRTARKDARSAEDEWRRGDSTEGVRVQQLWARVVSAGCEFLTHEAKDLEVAAWLVEALPSVSGYAGIRDGLALLQGLVSTYWDVIHPPVDPDDGFEDRVRILSGLSGEQRPGILTKQMSFMPVTSDNSGRQFALWEYEQALQVRRVADDAERQARMAQLGFTVDTISSAASASPASFYRDALDDLRQSKTNLNGLDSALTQQCGHDGPAVSLLREAMERLEEALAFLGKGHIVAAGNASEDVVDSVSSDVPAESSGVAPASIARSGPISSRVEAVKLLHQVAQFFRETEPHSPVAYTIEKAASWSEKSLSELVDEWIPDSSARQHFRLMTGMPEQPIDD